MSRLLFPLGPELAGNMPFYYEWCGYQAGNDIRIQMNIFALGSTLFEVETTKVYRTKS